MPTWIDLTDSEEAWDTVVDEATTAGGTISVGAAAFRNIGQTADTVASGDDPRLTGTDITELDTLLPTESLDGSEIIPCAKGGIPIGLTSDELTGSPIDAVMTRSRLKWREFTLFTQTPKNYVNTTSETQLAAEPWEFICGGTGAEAEQTAALFEYGSIDLKTGSTSSGYAALVSNYFSTGYLFSASTVSLDLRFRVSISNIPTVTENYNATVGLTIVANASHPSDFASTPSQGVFFRASTNSANWEAVTKDSIGETVTDTGVSLLFSGYETLAIDYDSDTGTALFKAEGNTVATHTTNIPVGGNVAVGGRIVKTAGTTSRSFSMVGASLVTDLAGAPATYL